MIEKTIPEVTILKHVAKIYKKIKKQIEVQKLLFILKTCHLNQKELIITRHIKFLAINKQTKAIPIFKYYFEKIALFI